MEDICIGEDIKVEQGIFIKAQRRFCLLIPTDNKELEAQNLNLQTKRGRNEARVNIKGDNDSL